MKKNMIFWPGLIFPILSSPRPVFHQNFAFSPPPAGKISHKSDNIPFLDLVGWLGFKIWCADRILICTSQNPRIQKKIRIFMKEMTNESKNSIFSCFSRDRGSKINQKKPKP